MTSKHPYSYMPNKPIDPYLLCCICKNAFINPVSTIDHRRGCRACLTGSSTFESEILTPIQEWIVLEMLNSLPVQCTKCELVNIRRGDLKQHEDQVCKGAIVSCQGADLKCPWKGAREQLVQHMDTCVFEPLRPALAEIIMETEQFKQQINQLELLIKRLKERTIRN